MFLAHFACKCNFPSCSSLKLLFPGLAFVYFSHAAQVSLINAFIPFSFMGCISSSAVIPSPLPVLSLQACCFSRSSPGGRCGASPCRWERRRLLLLYPPSCKAAMRALIRVDKRSKSLSALAGSVGAGEDETLPVLLRGCLVAEELQALPPLMQPWRAMLPCRCCFVPPFAPGEIGSASSDERLQTLRSRLLGMFPCLLPGAI